MDRRKFLIERFFMKRQCKDCNRTFKLNPAFGSAFDLIEGVDDSPLEEHCPYCGSDKLEIKLELHTRKEKQPVAIKGKETDSKLIEPGPDLMDWKARGFVTRSEFEDHYE